ncbi:MAG: TIGR02996 domain-containing protein [Gemmataceae bacterium]
MTDEAALRAAVLAHPDDDTPRLVYADWCDDAGDADRAAFIRAQVEAARAEPWSPAARDAEARAAALLGRLPFEWDTPVTLRSPEFGRGFVEGVEVTADDVDDRLAEMRQSHPIRRLRLVGPLTAPSSWDGAPVARNVFAAASLSGVTTLDLSATRIYGFWEYDTLAEAEPLVGLRELITPGRPVPPEWLSRFLAGPELPALEALDLTDVPNLGPMLADGLAKAPHRAFTKLNAGGVRFLSRELKRLLESPPLAAVEQLRLEWTFTPPGPATMIDLGWLLPWAKLRLLDLAGHGLGDDGVREITDRREAAGLRWLGLARNHLGDGGARRLLESRHLHLYHLDVSGNDVSRPLLAELRARFPDAVVVG